MFLQLQKNQNLKLSYRTNLMTLPVWALRRCFFFRLFLWSLFFFWYIDSNYVSWKKFIINDTLGLSSNLLLNNKKYFVKFKLVSNVLLFSNRHYFPFIIVIKKQLITLNSHRSEKYLELVIKKHFFFNLTQLVCS